MKKLMTDLGGGKSRCRLCAGSLPVIDDTAKVEAHIVEAHEDDYVNGVASSPVVQAAMAVAKAVLPPLPAAA